MKSKLVAPFLSAIALLHAVACSDEAAPSAATDAGAEASADASIRPVCATTRAFVLACGGELNCGEDKYDAWCASNDAIVNSDAFRRAEDACLVAPARCEAKARRDCEYRHYGTETPTASQGALVAAYCATCEPGDVAACTARSTSYDSAAGPALVSDIFIAAWELSDPLCDKVRVKCTGMALDAGGDCAAGFARCAGDVYLAALPDCPP